MSCHYPHNGSVIEVTSWNDFRNKTEICTGEQFNLIQFKGELEGIHTNYPILTYYGFVWFFVVAKVFYKSR